MEESDTLQKHYSCFLLQRPRREHHWAEDTETSGRRTLHIHKCQSYSSLEWAGGWEATGEMVLYQQKVIICNGRLNIAASPGGWRSSRERKHGDVSSGTWWVPYRAGSCTSLEECLGTWQCHQRVHHWVMRVWTTHSALFTDFATKKEGCQPCLQFPSSSFMVTLKSGRISMKIQNELKQWSNSRCNQ